ncbi:MAG: OsmC family protein [Marinomonas sp.]
MSEYYACVQWHKGEDENFIDNQYSRAHQWHFDGGLSVPASSSPHIVPLPFSVEANVDPEEAFVASLSSCHMLFFLSIAAKKRYLVNEYKDDAIGLMEEDEEGKIAMTKVTLRPYVAFLGERQPSLEQLEKMHHQAHDLCFIANSVKTQIETQVRLSLD